MGGLVGLANDISELTTASLAHGLGQCGLVNPKYIERNWHRISSEGTPEESKYAKWMIYECTFYYLLRHHFKNRYGPLWVRIFVETWKILTMTRKTYEGVISIGIFLLDYKGFLDDSNTVRYIEILYSRKKAILKLRHIIHELFELFFLWSLKNWFCALLLYRVSILFCEGFGL